MPYQLIEECCSWWSEGSAEMQAEEQSAGCVVGLAVVRRMKQAVELLGVLVEGFQHWTAAVTPVADPAVLLLASASPGPLGPSIKSKANLLIPRRINKQRLNNRAQSPRSHAELAQAKHVSQY